MSRQRKLEMPPNQANVEDNLDDAMHELSFEDEPAPLRAGDEYEPHGAMESGKRVREAGLTEAAMPEHTTTADDASPETLINESGDDGYLDEDDDVASDEELSVREIGEIGAGYGLDEAELGRRRPLDGKPWDGDPSEPL